jgi:large subunit ribosomal protein L22
MALQVHLRNYRVAARKARLVADLVRGKPVEHALAVLDLSPKRFARPLAKLVRSAVANATESNHRSKAGVDVDNLVVSEIRVDEGPTMWRIKARAQGRATWIQRRSSHVTVVLEER